MNIGGSRGGKCQGYARLGLLFSCSFQEKLVKIIEWTPLFWDWRPLSTEPPLLNAQKHAYSRERSLNQSCCEYIFDCLFNINSIILNFQIQRQNIDLWLSGQDNFLSCIEMPFISNRSRNKIKSTKKSG